MFKLSELPEDCHNKLHFNAIMCAISNSVQRGDPYSQKIWQLQPPLSDPLPHPLGAERNPHTQRRGSTPWPSAQSQGHTHTHTQRQAGRQAGCWGIWEWCTGNAGEQCVSISLFRNANSFPQPWRLYPVPWAAWWPTERVDLTGLMGPSTQTRCCCARATGLKWQQHLYSLTSQPLRVTFMCFWLFYRPPLSVLLTRDWDILFPQH